MKVYTLGEIRALFREWLDQEGEDDLFWHLPGREEEPDPDIYSGDKICLDGRVLPFPLWLERRDAQERLP